MDRFQKLEQVNRLLTIAHELLHDNDEKDLAGQIVAVMDEVNEVMYELERDAALDN